MQLTSGFFDKSGSPCLKIRLAGVFDANGLEFDAIIDTGFTGFLAMPIVRAFPLGLPLYGTTSSVLADGSKSTTLTALGTITVCGKALLGLVLLQANSQTLLLGMDFLRKFNLLLLVLDKHVALMDEAEFMKFAQATAAAMNSQAPGPSAAAPKPTQGPQGAAGVNVGQAAVPAAPVQPPAVTPAPTPHP